MPDQNSEFVDVFAGYNLLEWVFPVSCSSYWEKFFSYFKVCFEHLDFTVVYSIVTVVLLKKSSSRSPIVVSVFPLLHILYISIMVLRLLSW